MQRRQFAQILLALSVSSRVAGAQQASGGPLFWSARKGRSRVYLLGVANAPDRAWYTPAIQRAFESSSQLWLEVHPGAAPGEDARAIVQKYGRSADRTFLESLEPDVRERAIAYLKELEIAPDTVNNLRPWFAYYSLAMAFDARRGKRTPGENPERVLTELANAQGKPVGYEYPSMASLMSVLAQMSDRAQNQYIAWLLDYFDAQKRGELYAEASWVNGKPDARSLDRMRKLPELYRVMQIERNAWWAARIEELLKSGSTHFIAVGMLHTLGPDSIQEALNRRAAQKENKFLLLSQPRGD